MFAWFTYTRSKNICFLVDGKSITPTHAAFSNRLALGTVLVGTLIVHEGKKTFVVEDCFYEAGRVCTEGPANVLKETSSHIFVASQVAFLEASRSHFSWVEAPYKIRCVKDVKTNHVRNELYATLKAVPHEQIDTYELFSTKSEGFACIDTIGRSVMMNDVFRFMPENHDLDYAEEEVADCVLGAAMLMECRYHHARKQWVPLLLV